MAEPPPGAWGDDAGAGSTGDETEDLSPTERLWNLLAHPADPWAAAEALVGMSSGAAHMLAAVQLLASAEAESLLTAMPRLSRSLMIGTTSRTERSVGEVKGPILWAETLAARAASAGDQASHVYTVAARAYDTAENRVLVSALAALTDAGRTVDTNAMRARGTPLAHLIHDRATDARFWLEHRTLVEVPRRRASGRERHRTRVSMRRRLYSPALDVLDRHAVPLTGQDLALTVDTRTNAQHVALLALVEGLAQRGVTLAPFAVHTGSLESGPLRYVHERSRRGRRGGAGIHLGEHLVDVPVIVEGRRILVGAAPAGDTGPAHLVLDSPGEVNQVLEAAGF